MMRRGGVWLPILYFVIGAYLLNIGLGFITMPSFITSVESWIIFLGGIFLIVGGINAFRLRRRYV